MDSYVEESEDADTLTAIQSLVFEGTPEETAENFKIQGNACYAAGKIKFKDAIKYYTKGISAKANDNELNSILYSNRAAVNLELGNFGSVLYDCTRAIKFNPKNVKAYFRSIKALIALDKVDEGIDCCLRAMEVDSQNIHFPNDLKKLRKRKEDLKELDRLRKIKEQKKREEAEYLESMKRKRNYNFVSLPINEEEDDLLTLQHPDAPTNRIELLSDGTLTFPVIFLYPEFNQSDVIASFSELDTFYAHFEHMFSEPAPWDPNHLYHPQTLDWYFETYPGNKNDKTELISVLKTCNANQAPSQSAAHRYVCLTLQDVLKNKQYPIIDGVATFVILSRNSEFSLRYRKEYRLRQE
ncbi:hypothetical protein BC833DRAFT_591202 [Globomyces pollinis-pini]|nr:hypothetical protein BC833DRAFT_591202 [Globomyces pollinis-pini]